jgi:sugar phosphate isomerase/epimerase
VDGATPEQHAQAAAAAGFGAAGLRVMPPTHLSAGGAVAGNPSAVRALAEACRRHGIRPLDAEVMTLTRNTDERAMAMMVDCTADLHFRFVQTVIEDEDLSRAGDKLAQLAALAEERGIAVALEFMAFRPLQNLRMARELCAHAGSDTIGLVIDALHVSRCGTSIDEIAALPEHMFALVQLCDAPAQVPTGQDLASEARSRRLYPGEGSLLLHELLDVIPDGTPLAIEIPHPDSAKLPFAQRAQKAMDELRSFLETREAASRS